MELVTILVIFFALLSAGLAVVLAFRPRAAAQDQGTLVLRRTDGGDRSASMAGAASIDHKFERLIYEAALPFNSTVAVLLCVLSALLIGGVVFLLREDLLMSSLAGLAGLLLPVGYFLVRRKRRLRLMEEQLPDAIDLMARAIHAGESLEQAIALAAKETDRPLGNEFSWCSRQMEMGLPVSTTMRRLSSRIRLLSIRTLATTLAVHRRAGGSLASTLEHLAEVCRNRLAFQRQVRAITAAGRLSAQMIAAAAPLIFVVLWFLYPDHIRRLLEEGPGRIMLTVGILLELIGIVWLTQLLRSDD